MMWRVFFNGRNYELYLAIIKKQRKGVFNNESKCKKSGKKNKDVKAKQ